MASDGGDYESFLDKANAPLSSKASTTSKPASKATTKSVNTDIPASLKKIESFYTSDVDEPFEPVSLEWSGKSIPSTDELKSLLDHASTIESIRTSDFNPRGHYDSVLKATAAESDDHTTQVFRVTHGETRAEYYVVGLDRKMGRIVGLKAKAVES